MRVVLSGGEKGTHRAVLVDNKAPAIALNITQFVIPKRKEVDLVELLGGAEVYVYTSDEDEDVEKYDEFIRAHADNLTCVIGRPDYNGDWLGDKYVPLWNDAEDVERLAYLCEKYGRVAVSDRAINAKTAPRIRQLAQRWNARLVGITSKVDVIESLPWDAVIVSSWTSVVRYGETQVWDGHGLRRYPAQKKDSARRKHRPDIVRLGVDYDAVIEGDVKELAKLAVLSWLEWEKHTYGQSSFAAYHPSSDEDEQEFDTLQTGDIVATSPETHTSGLSSSTPSPIATVEPTRRHQSEKKLLPVIGLELAASADDEDDENPDNTGKQDHVVSFQNSGVRHCDSCYLAPRCPEFREHADCAFELPVQIKTKEQLRAVMNFMIEMQTSRVMFAKFAEDIEGQGMDPALSAEMDRLFRLLKDAKDIEDTRDLFRFEVEARGGSGVLSRIFGERAAPVVETPMNQAQLDRAIIDAEVLD